MSEEQDGGPAFPTPVDQFTRVTGMSLRDYFAAKAVQGLMGRVWEADGRSDQEIIEMWAGSAYAVADAMLAVRES